MQILVTAATAKELSPFLRTLPTNTVVIKKHSVDVLITGIGLTATTFKLTKQLTLKKYDAVVQVGVAGCFKKTIPLGSVVAIKKDTIADQSVIELQQLKTLFDLQLVPHNSFPYKNKWLVNPHQTLLLASQLKTVSAISVNEITTNKKKTEWYQQTFKPVAESMEGAAFHYVCLMENLPFVQLRSMSNYIGERNKKKWNMVDAITNLNNALQHLLEQL
jgi:futalosine hydrolase